MRLRVIVRREQSLLLILLQAGAGILLRIDLWSILLIAVQTILIGDDGIIQITEIQILIYSGSWHKRVLLHVISES
jgi:hypothetical protein